MSQLKKDVTDYAVTLFPLFVDNADQNDPELVKIVLDAYCMFFASIDDELGVHVFHYIIREKLEYLTELEQLVCLKQLLLTGIIVGLEKYAVSGTPYLLLEE